MSTGFFIIGGVIFAFYMYFTFWNIVYSNKKQRKENYPTISNGDDIKLRKLSDEGSTIKYGKL